MRIWLVDLCYLDDSDNNAVIPLGIGFIASYLKNFFPDISVELFKDPRRVYDRLQESPPDVLALSQYTWNVRLDYVISKKAKELNPDMAVVMGGPFFDSRSPDWMKKFFTDHPQLDLYITGPGEWSFTEFIRLLLEHQNSFDNIPVEEWPDSFYGFNRPEKAILHNESKPAKPLDLAEIPSPYLTGVLDKFLEEGILQPIIETSRGCPYSCTFCCWGSTDKSKIFHFPRDRVFEEINYLVKNHRNPGGQMYIADGNFGINSHDVELSEFIKKKSEGHGFPKSTYVYYAKNVNDRIIAIAKNLKSVSRMAMSKQSLNPKTLEYIKRQNISNDKYEDLKVDCEKNGINTYCELIYMLPGETYDSFLNGVITTIRKKQTVEMQVLRTDIGSEISTTESRDFHGMKTAYRVLPYSVWRYKDIYSLEYDEIVIGNNYVPYDDFKKLRLFHFGMFVFNNATFKELHKGLEICGLDYGSLIRKIIEDNSSWTPKFREIMEGFQAAAENELLLEKETKYEFTQSDIDAVNVDETALNPFYFCSLVAKRDRVTDLHEYLSNAIERFFGDQLTSEDLSDLKETLNLSMARLACYEDLQSEKFYSCEYDIKAWQEVSNDKPLRFYKLDEKRDFKLVLDDDIIPAFTQAMKSGKSIEHVVYYLRMHVLHLWGDRIYYYNWSD